MLFPPRNRIISALSDAVLVVEAREKSGTLITVDMALEQGKDVFTVPGRCMDSLSIGCNRLLRQGATAATAPEDIVEDMRWEALPQKVDRQVPKFPVEKLSAVAQEVYAVIGGLPATQDVIVSLLREKGKSFTIPQICQGLVELELKGFIAFCNRQYKRT